MTEPLAPLAESLSPRDRFREDIRRIATYTSQDLGGEGTGGWLLSEAQFAAIGRAADWYADERAAALVQEHASTPRRQQDPRQPR